MSETNETIVNPCSQPDRAMNAYLRYPDTFAQAVNIAMDQEWLRPEDLIPFERDRNYRFESGPLKELSRDVLMARTRKGEVIGLIGIENQAPTTST